MMKTAAELAGTTLRAQVAVIGSGAGGAVAATRLAEMTQDEASMLPRLMQEEGRRTTHDQSISILQGRSLGGGTYHNTGLCVPVSERTWKQWSTEAAVPASYAEFEPDLRAVMDAIGARRADADEINDNNRILQHGAEGLGWSAFVSHHNRSRCSGCGFCTLGCAYNRKWSTVHAFLPDGVAAGLRIVVDAEVVRLRAHDQRWTLETRAGVRVTADRVIVSAGAIHTPLLLREAGVRAPAIGDGLRLHPFAPVGARFGDEVVAWRGVPQTVIVDAFASGSNEHGGYLLIGASAQPGIASIMSATHGSDHRAQMQQLRHCAMGGVLVHDEARGSVRRRWGRPQVRYWPSPRDVAALREGVTRLATLYFEMGAEEVFLPFREFARVDSPSQLEAIERVPIRPHSVILGSVHPQGTCAMGADRKRAAVGEDGGVFGAPGLYVADTSLFPSSIGIPPQVTTMALGRRIADRLADRLTSQHGNTQRRAES